MATIKVKFRASSLKTKEGSIYYQVIHKRVVRQICMGYKLYESEWNMIRSKIVIFPDVQENRRKYLLSLKATLERDMSRLRSIVFYLDKKIETYTTDRIVELFHSEKYNGTFIEYAQNLIHELKRIGKSRIAETYGTTLNSFIRFRKGCDIHIESIDSDLMVEYEFYLKSTGICPNSSSFYMRNMRAIYNRAVEKGLTTQTNPFKHVYTGIDKTVKRAVPLNVIREIKKLDLTMNRSMDYARDLFMFSFYTRGMSFIDMAYLKKKDLKNGILSYRRKKTNKQLLIKWEKPMQEILNKYNNTDSPYLLPIIKTTGVDERKQYKNAAQFVNSKLKRLGEQIRLSIPLTSYVARHAWASIAMSKNIPIAIISEAMGHDSENTTRIYLASLDNTIVDNANNIILKSL